MAPGFITGRWWNEGQGEEVAAKVQAAAEAAVPLKAVCDPDDVANAVLGFLINDLSTGQVVVVDGGMLIKL